MSDRIMIAVDPDKLDAILSRLETLETVIRSVKITPPPEWMTVTEYADSVGVTTRTVRNWVDAGKVDTRREGEVLFIRVSRAA